MLNVVRRIRENIHGTIDITALEDRVISHRVVQRLRRIKQLAFLQFVFPGASHSRFEHSLGVLHLAAVAWEKLRANQHRIWENSKRYDNFAEAELSGVRTVHGLLAPTFSQMNGLFGSEYILQALRLAGLLHDIGHAPFSHSGELFMPSWSAVMAAAEGKPSWIRNYLAGQVERISKSGRDPTRVRVRHEIFTLLLIDQVMNDVYAEPGWSGIRIEAQDIAAIITTEIPPAPASPLSVHGAQRLCHELVSGEFDVDRMDYLLRDSRECGVVYGIYDSSRILNSLGLWYNPEDKQLHLAIHFSGLAAFEDYLRARHSMYLQLYFHKTSVAAEAMIQNLSKQLGGWTLPADAERYAQIDEHNISEHLTRAAEVAIKDPLQLRRFKETVDDLLFNRRLWKRVYEISGNTVAEDVLHGEAATLDVARQLIADLGFAFEQVSSRNSLTRFLPRSGNEPSKNYLRLIKKDARQFPRVVPIEDHFSLIAASPSIEITRLYVESGNDAAGHSIPRVVRDALTKRLLSAE